MSDWPTQQHDMHIAEMIIEQYALEHNSDSLGLFEVIFNEKEKSMDLRLSAWVILLAKEFNSLYGALQGDRITRQVITRCMTRGETVH